ncbi:uncharacterized protein LOC129749182 [Uranotaenia lowii]|uniref:uncharacterized protein LOC129749182 n=1 Tax=Uranotaenia lowii TaxID=190385 RepID=UPI00247ADA76|nr:uncharacterized protein LOC129749182 [Uranotaenia lowii]
MDDSLFNGLGCVRDFVYDIDLVENPSFHSSLPRRIPHSLREAVKKELDCMQEMGVIEPISEPTPVLNAMVIVRQKDESSELFYEPTTTLLNATHTDIPRREIDTRNADVPINVEDARTTGQRTRSGREVRARRDSDYEYY